MSAPHPRPTPPHPSPSPDLACTHLLQQRIAVGALEQARSHNHQRPLGRLERLGHLPLGRLVQGVGALTQVLVGVGQVDLQR